MGLDAEQTRAHCSIAGSQSAGLRENFGTMTKPFHAGRSSESGVVAAQFAALRLDRDRRSILEAPRGFFKRGGRRLRPVAIDGKLGRPGPSPIPASRSSRIRPARSPIRA